MSLREWDRKVAILQNEVSALLAEKSNHRPSPDTLAQLKRIRQVQKWQLRLEKNLAFLASMVRRKHFLSMQEKTLLHWAREFTEKTGGYYRDYISALNTLLWAKLVQSRSMSVTYDSNQSLSEASEADLIKSYQQQQQQTKDKMLGYLGSLNQKKAALRARYEALVVAYVNDEAHALLKASSAHLTPVSPHVLSFKDRLSHTPPSNAANQILARMQRESVKLSHLTLSARRPTAAGRYPRPPAEAGEPARWRQVDQLFEKFDYMNLDASLDPLNAEPRHPLA